MIPIKQSIRNSPTLFTPAERYAKGGMPEGLRPLQNSDLSGFENLTGLPTQGVSAGYNARPFPLIWFPRCGHYRSVGMNHWE